MGQLLAADRAKRDARDPSPAASPGEREGSPLSRPRACRGGPYGKEAGPLPTPATDVGVAGDANSGDAHGQSLWDIVDMVTSTLPVPAGRRSVTPESGPEARKLGPHHDCTRALGCVPSPA